MHHHNVPFVELVQFGQVPVLVALPMRVWSAPLVKIVEKATIILSKVPLLVRNALLVTNATVSGCQMHWPVLVGRILVVKEV